MATSLYEQRPPRRLALPASIATSLSNTGPELVREAHLEQVQNSHQQLHVQRALEERLVTCLVSLLFTENATRATTVQPEHGPRALMALLIQPKHQQVAFAPLATSAPEAQHCLLRVLQGRISAHQE